MLHRPRVSLLAVAVEAVIAGVVVVVVVAAVAALHVDTVIVALRVLFT